MDMFRRRRPSATSISRASPKGSLAAISKCRISGRERRALPSKLVCQAERTGVRIGLAKPIAAVVALPMWVSGFGDSTRMLHQGFLGGRGRELGLAILGYETGEE